MFEILTKCKNSLFFNRKLKEEIDEQSGSQPSWDDIPTEILLLIFENLPTSSLHVCMFVSQTWRDCVEYVMENQNKWACLFNISEFKLKCEPLLERQRMFYNNVLWCSLPKATVGLHEVREINKIKKIKVYKDCLTVLTKDNVRRYDTHTLNTQSTLDESTCDDFEENDFMVVKVIKQGEREVKLQLIRKLAPNVISTAESDMLFIEYALCYKIHNEDCHVVDSRNSHEIYTIVDGKWKYRFLTRYYGNPADTVAINVINDRIYLMVNGYYILWMDKDDAFYKKMTQINVFNEKSNDRKTIRNRQRIDGEHSEDMHRRLFIWSCMVEINKDKQLLRHTYDGDPISLRLCTHTAKEGLRFLNRDHLWASPLNESIIYPYIVRYASCVLVHGDILFVGHFDGTVELICSRDLLRTKMEPIRCFNVKDFKEDITDSAVLSIDVYEEEDIQHLFIATNTYLFHLHITHTNCEDYMWSEEAFQKSTASFYICS